MKRIASIGILGAWAMLGNLGLAQMSSFPPPPPLPAPQSSQSSPSQSPNDSTGAPSGSGTGTANASPAGQGTNPDALPATPTPAPNPDAAAGANGGNAPAVTAELLASMSALDDKDKLEPGDLISFRVIEDRDPAVPRVVTDTGEVDFPYVGRVKVQGMTCHDVAVELKKLLEVDYYKQATVIVGLDMIANRGDKTAPPVITHDMVWVVGQVRSVGPQEILPNQPMTVSQIILRAGGFGDFADQRKVKIVHRGAAGGGGLAPSDDGQNGEIIDVKAILEGQRDTVDPVVRPNDLIVVPKRLINF